MNKLTDKHLCYVLFLEMEPESFISFMESNFQVENLVPLDSRRNRDLYDEAKKNITALSGTVEFNFDYESEPYVFDKYIDGKFDRTYKICIFEQNFNKNKFAGKTSDMYCDGMPLFYDFIGNVIKISNN